MTTALQLFNKLDKKDSDYGPRTMIVGDPNDANERIYDLDGMRVEAATSSQDGTKTGTIQAVYINQRTRRVQIVVSMDNKTVRVFRPRRLTPLNDLIE